MLNNFSANPYQRVLSGTINTPTAKGKDPPSLITHCNAIWADIKCRHEASYP